jgi:hypothetical protein
MLMLALTWLQTLEQAFSHFAASKKEDCFFSKILAFPPRRPSADTPQTETSDKALAQGKPRGVSSPS